MSRESNVSWQTTVDMHHGEKPTPATMPEAKESMSLAIINTWSSLSSIICLCFIQQEVRNNHPQEVYRPSLASLVQQSLTERQRLRRKFYPLHCMPQSIKEFLGSSGACCVLGRRILAVERKAEDVIDNRRLLQVSVALQGKRGNPH